MIRSLGGGEFGGSLIPALAVALMTSAPLGCVPDRSRGGRAGASAAEAVEPPDEGVDGREGDDGAETGPGAEAGGDEGGSRSENGEGSADEGASETDPGVEGEGEGEGEGEVEPEIVLSDYAGEFLLSVGTNIPMTLQFFATLALRRGEGDRYLMDLSLQPLKTHAPPDRSPVGEPLTVNDEPWVLDTDGFNVAFGTPDAPVTISGFANLLTGTDIVLSFTMGSHRISPNRFCGAVQGELWAPIPGHRLLGSTFSAIRVDGIDDLPEPEIRCPDVAEEGEGEEAEGDEGGLDGGEGEGDEGGDGEVCILDLEGRTHCPGGEGEGDCACDPLPDVENAGGVDVTGIVLDFKTLAPIGAQDRVLLNLLQPLQPPLSNEEVHFGFAGVCGRGRLEFLDAAVARPPTGIIVDDFDCGADDWVQAYSDVFGLGEAIRDVEKRVFAIRRADVEQWNRAGRELTGDAEFDLLNPPGQLGGCLLGRVLDGRGVPLVGMQIRKGAQAAPDTYMFSADASALVAGNDTTQSGAFLISPASLGSYRAVDPRGAHEFRQRVLRGGAPGTCVVAEFRPE